MSSGSAPERKSKPQTSPKAKAQTPPTELAWLTLPRPSYLETTLALRLALAMRGITVHSVETSNGYVQGVIVHLAFAREDVRPLFALGGLEAGSMADLPFELPPSAPRQSSAAVAAMLVMVARLTLTSDDKAVALVVPNLATAILDKSESFAVSLLAQAILNSFMQTHVASPVFADLLCSDKPPTCEDLIKVLWPIRDATTSTASEITIPSDPSAGTLPAGTLIVIEADEGMCNRKLIASEFANGRQFHDNEAGVSVRLDGQSQTEHQILAKLKSSATRAIKNHEKCRIAFRLRSDTSVHLVANFFASWGVFADATPVFGLFGSSYQYDVGMSLWRRDTGAKYFSRIDAPGTASAIDFTVVGSLWVS